MEQQKRLKEVLVGDERNNPPTFYKDILLCDFYDKLSSKAQINKLNFIAKNNLSPSLDIPHHKPQKQKPNYLSNMEKSLFNTKSVLLPALRNKRKAEQYRQKLIINETIFIHERVQVNQKRKTILVDQKWKNKKQSLPLPNLSVDNKKEKARNNSRTEHQAKSLKAIDGNDIEGSHMDRVSPSETLTRHQSNGRIEKETYQYPIADDSDQIRMPTELMTFDPSTDLSKKKTKIQRMILYYHSRKQKAQQKSISMRSIANETLEELNKMNIKGQQTISKRVNKKQSPPKKINNLTKDRSFEQLAKIRYSSWKNRQFPFTELARVEANRLLVFYIGIKEVVPIQTGNYKVYVGDGNNGQLVSRLLKNRGWWVTTDDINEAHLIWTQHPPELMKKIESSQNIKLKKESTVNFDIPENSVWEKEVESLKKFLKYKNNNYLQSCSKLLHPIVYHRVGCEVADRFKDNRFLKGYQNLKEVVGRCLTIPPLTVFQAKNTTLFNHCEFSSEIGQKKNLMFHIEKYCQLNQIDKNQLIPKTLHINEQDLQVIKEAKDSLLLLQHKLSFFTTEDSLYYLKPGECSNRGNGISVHASKTALAEHISRSLTSFPQDKTYIVQECIDPLLYQGRKFDIRVWVLFAHNKLWFYKQGYIRTSCKEYSPKNLNKFIHLTNDAVQKQADDYGRFEPANKVSYQDLDKYLKKTYNYQQFYSQICQKIKNLAKILFEAGMLMMGRTNQQFQLFGLDFIIDKKYQVWLIQCNSNPSIQTCCSLLNRLVPNMLDNVLSIAVDPHFPPNQRRVVREDSSWPCDRFNFELLSDATLQTNYLERVSEDQQYLAYLKKVNPHKLGDISSSFHDLNIDS